MMRNMLRSGLGVLAVLAMVGCGGPVEDTQDLMLADQEQELPMCKVDEPQPCPTGYTCVNRVCRPDPL
ncbi:hypothetical protein A176_003490 [Myxococcus hansupus]|uniref:Lipoprotein n=1 Tax=Pseudomyxococcus hansupus TaxID=1297742 RepID=A0A0H4WYA4_9BACT|nr:hypothetical protein [Myxococcus hansupus]AKQ66578.1 hypothetical protein A176_003490 [Myxococcus hansupus]